MGDRNTSFFIGALHFKSQAQGPLTFSPACQLRSHWKTIFLHCCHVFCAQLHYVSLEELHCEPNLEYLYYGNSRLARGAILSASCMGMLFSDSRWSALPNGICNTQLALDDQIGGHAGEISMCASSPKSSYTTY